MTDLALIDHVARALGPLARRQVPLAPLCTYKVGGPAALFATIGHGDQLELMAQALAEAAELPLLVIGRGSNLLVADAGFDGLVVQLGESLARIEVEADAGLLRLGAAALLPVAARRSAAESLAGFEWAVGVPGSVGGAVRMNAGGHGSDMAASLRRVSLFDLRAGRGLDWTPAQLALGYRSSAVAPHHVVLSAELQLDAGRREESEAEISEIVRWRRANQPGGQNAGSVFTNPPGSSAGRIIDRAGLKGLRIGTAEVSTKHANFIQADPDGSGDDVYRLIATIRRRIWEHFGVLLHCENLLIGFDQPLDEPLAEPATGPVAGLLDGAS